jgi:peptidoglycan/LPS O-acetylase OafA/YrhL
MADRSEQLDGLRAVAALSVLAFHVRLPGFHGGFIGVDVFFVLSGFLITRLLRAEATTSGRIDLKAFAARRAARLLPALLITVVAVVATLPLLFPAADPWAESVLPLLYLSDFSRAFYRTPDAMQHTWSLAVEVHFYMLWPLVVLAFRGASDRTFALAMLALFAVATAWRIIVFGASDDWARVYYAFDTRLSGLVIGSALAAISWCPERRQADALAAASGVALLICAGSLRLGKAAAMTWGGIVVDVAAAVLILALLVPGSGAARLLAWPPLVRVGLWSYALYLWHYPIARLARANLDSVSAFAVTAAVALPLAWLTYEYLELPIRTWWRARKRTRLAV